MRLEFPKFLFLITALLSAITSTNAFAIPTLAKPELWNTHSFETLSDTTYNFDGIIEIRSIFGGCSASLVRFDFSKDSDKAIILTNGHCLEGGMPGANTFVFNKNSNRKFNVLDPKTANVLGRIEAEKIMYGTMTGTDLALYKLTTTYKDIQSKFGVNALTLDRGLSPVGEKIEIISGYWKRGFSCEIELVVPTLKEGEWTMNNSIRYSRPGCEVYGGTSGSPILRAGTRTVVGINNTGNESGEKCTLNNPCEVDESGNITAVKGYGYGQQIKNIYNCLNNLLEIDLSLSTCNLYGGSVQ